MPHVHVIVNIGQSVNTAKHSAAALDDALAAKLKELLRLPGFSDWTVTTNPAPFNRAFDLLATGKSPHGPVIELWVDCRLEPRPSQFPYVAIEREFDQGSTKKIRARIFAAPHISPRMAEICESHHWSWFDLAGNCKITVPTFLHIERRGIEPAHDTPRPIANLGSPETGRVIRALLAPENANRATWTQRAILEETDPHVSLGLVNKVSRYLREEAFVEEVTNGIRLRDPLKLLFAWRDAYRFDQNTRYDYFTLLSGKRLGEALTRFGSRGGVLARYAAFSAAEFQAPHVRQPKIWMYIGVKNRPLFEALLEAKSVDSGENIIVLIPEDLGVFQWPWAANGGMSCTNPVQTYVDLWHSGGRGKEAADALLERRLKPQWKNKGLQV